MKQKAYSLKNVTGEGIEIIVTTIEKVEACKLSAKSLGIELFVTEIEIEKEEIDYNWVSRES